MSLPTIREVGRLTENPQLRYTAGGKAVTSLNIAFNKRKKNPDTGVWEDSGVLFVRATAWEKLAENCAESLTKGDEVVVVGELSMEEYERKDGSGKGQSLKLHVYEIGVSLRWNIAKVARATRSGGSDDSSGGYGSGPPAADDPWTSVPPTKASAGGYDSKPPW